MSVIFNGTSKSIIISKDQRLIDVQKDLYSRSVDWIRENSCFIPPFISEGGGSLIDLSPAPMIFRFNDKWIIELEKNDTARIQIIRFVNGYLALQDKENERVILKSNQFYQNGLYFDHKFNKISSHRQYLRDHVSLVKKAHHNDMLIGFIYLDIDNFKELNTRYTETVVDNEILPLFIETLKELIENEGFCYREGGDEFICMIPIKDKQELIELSESLRKKINTTPIKGEEISISIGITVSTNENDSEMQKRANQAKANAKNNGRNRVESVFA